MTLSDDEANDKPKLSVNDGAYETLNTITTEELKEQLFSDDGDNIIFNSLMKISSTKTKRRSYVQCCATLTNNAIYFLSATNYQIWQEFRDRSKIDEVCNDYEEKIHP